MILGRGGLATGCAEADLVMLFAGDQGEDVEGEELSGAFELERREAVWVVVKEKKGGVEGCSAVLWR